MKNNSDEKNNSTPALILASASPRRVELLRGAGILFSQEVADIDETPENGESPAKMVQRLSLEKARCVSKLSPKSWILGADTTVVVDNQILGKPVDARDAKRMLQLIQGRTHTVVGGFALINAKNQTEYFEVHNSEVTIVPLTSVEIDAYIETGEPLDKAGSYAIQGIGAGLVEKVSGSYTNVVGLNLAAVITALKKFEVI